MAKTTKSSILEPRRGRNGVLAISLTFALATFGCTTNKMPGDGQPTSSGPSLGPAVPTSVPGTSSGTHGTPGAALTPADDAAATMAARQAYRGRYLGPSAPGAAPATASAPIVTGQYIPPSNSANPQLTVNNTISSPGIPVIVSGAGEDPGLFGHHGRGDRCRHRHDCHRHHRRLYRGRDDRGHDQPGDGDGAGHGHRGSHRHDGHYRYRCDRDAGDDGGPTGRDLPQLGRCDHADREYLCSRCDLECRRGGSFLIGRRADQSRDHGSVDRWDDGRLHRPDHLGQHGALE
jgi:hypothetical protein